MPVWPTSERAGIYLVVLVATFLRFYQLQFGQWRNDEEIIWLQALRAIATRQFPWVGIPSDLGIANGPGQMLPVLPAALLGAPYIAYVLVASLNVLAVAALYRLGRLWGGANLGLAAAAVCATSPWAVIHSRRLWGNDMLAPFAVLFVTALWLFVARRRRWRIVEAAAWLAFVLQMYVAAIVQLATLAVGLAVAAVHYRRRLHAIALPVLIALVAFAALTVGYGVSAFLAHMTDLTRAVRDTRSATPQPVGLPNWGGISFLIQSVRSDGYQFYATHSARWPSGTMGLVDAGDWLTGFLFACGLAFLVWRLLSAVIGRGPGYQERLTASALLVTWLLAIPTALLIHNAPVCACFLLPSYPAQYLVVALGAVAVGGVLTRLVTIVTVHVPNRRLSGSPTPGPFGPAAATVHPLAVPLAPAGRFLAWLLLGSVLLLQMGAAGPFFGGIKQYWPSDQYGLPYDWHGRIVVSVAAVWRPGMSIVISGHGELDGVLRDEVNTRLPAVHARLVDDQRWLALPAAAQPPMVVLLTPGNSVAHDALRALVKAHPESLRATLTIPGAGEQFRVLEVAPADAVTLEELLAPASNRHNVGVQFASAVRLDRYALAVRLLPGQLVPVALQWTILQTQPYIPAYSFYVHLADANGTTAGFDAPFFPPNLWQQGEQVWTFGTLSDPGQSGGVRDALIGLYQLKGADARDGVIPIPTTINGGKPITELRQGPFVVHTAHVTTSAVVALKTNFAPGLALVSATVPSSVNAGSALAVTLQWQATESEPPRYTVFLHLLDQSGVVRAQQDVEPDGGRFPSSSWLLHELVTDAHSLALPPTLAPGDDTLVIGVYPTGQPDKPYTLTWPQGIRVVAR